MNTSATDRPSALVFRKKLLPWSETFIAAQARALSRYRPVLAGYAHDPGGRVLLEGLESVVLEDHSAMLQLGKLMLKAGYVPRRWLRAIRSSRPVLVHAHFGTSAPPAMRVARALGGVPLVITYWGMDITKVARTWQERRRRRTAFTAAQRVIAASRFIRDTLIAEGCPAEKVVVHYIGVDTDFFSPGVEPRAPNRVLFVGRLVPKKGLAHLLRAMSVVQGRVPAAEVVVAGDGPLRASLEREASGLGVRCSFLGVQTPRQVRDLMRTSAVLCGPSVVEESGNTEGLGLVFLEAQAAGLPVVVSRAGGAEETVRHSETGFLTMPGDEEALSAHLLPLLNDTAMRQRVGEAARAHVLATFDLRKQTAELERVYDEIVGEFPNRHAGRGKS